MSSPGGPHKPSTALVLGALIAFGLFTSGVLIATVFAPPGHNTTVATGFIVTVAGPTILGLLNLIRADRTNRLVANAATALTDVQEKVNGHLDSHRDLTTKAIEVANSAMRIADSMPGVHRDPTSRTRAADAPQGVPGVATGQSVPVDQPPLADQR